MSVCVAVPPYTDGPGQITSPRSPATGAAYTRPDCELSLRSLQQS